MLPPTLTNAIRRACCRRRTPAIEILSHCAASATVNSSEIGPDSFGADVKDPRKPALPSSVRIISFCSFLGIAQDRPWATLSLAVLGIVAAIKFDCDLINTIGHAQKRIRQTFQRLAYIGELEMQ